MYNEIIEGIKNQVSNDELKSITSSNLHLGVFSEPCLTYMLDGAKTIESRFSKKNTLPYNRITSDDIIFVKKSGGDVVAYIKIDKVVFYDLDEYDINKIKSEYNSYLCVDDSFWESKKDSKYGTLIFIKEIIHLKPFHINKKGMNTWIKLKED